MDGSRRIGSYPGEMPWTDALIAIPAYSPRPSGLLVPTEHSRPTVTNAGDSMPDGIPIPEDAIFIMANPPSAFEQMRVVIDENGLGLRQSTPAELREMAAALCFENGMVALARMSAHAWHIKGDMQAQLKLAPEIFGDPRLVARIRLLAKGEPERLEIFPEQHSTALARLLVLYARDGTPGSVAEGEQEVFNRAYIGAATLTAERDRDTPRGADGRGNWIAYLIQNGTYNRSEDSLCSMIRPQILLRDIAQSEVAREHSDFCDVDGWHRERFGLGLSDQFALGFVLCGRSQIFEESVAIGERSVVGRSYFADLLTRLGGNLDQGLELLSAPREWYRTEFEKRPDTDSNAAWDRIAFEMRPLLRLENGELLLLSPRTLESWLGDGFYHRSLQIARERGEVERFQRFYGSLVEEHALRLLRDVHTEHGSLGIGRVFGEQRYGRKGAKRSPDIAVDCGTDLILFEVTSGRFTLDTVLEGSPQAALKDLGRLLFKKAGQLDRRIDDFLVGDWSLPNLESEHIQRIWPIVVTADVLQNELLWDEIREHLGGLFSQPKTQRLTVLDLADLEQLSALVERGHSLLDLVTGKARGPYAELDFRRYVADTPGLSVEVRPSLLDQRWLNEVDKAAGAFGLDTTSLESERVRRELRDAA